CAAEPGVESLMKRGWLFLEDEEWKQADEYFDRVLDIDPEHAPAYLGKLCAELKIKDEADLANHAKTLDDMQNYQRALHFADADFRALIEGYNQAIMACPFQVGAVIQFGGYDWRVLDVQDNRALILSDKIIEKRAYHNIGGNIIWEVCDLRSYLNGEFLQKFTAEDQERIVETRINNPDNLWYGVTGGNDTTDKVFLLSLEEADRYFGDSGDYENKRRKRYEGQHPNGEWVPANDGRVFSNTSDSGRITEYNDEASWWWLRSPGIYNSLAADVNLDGFVNVRGILIYNVHGGVRPALWLHL
ncbi:MAG: DUF6273 domain-containing protein, partial [Synergistaceae bacterium]|nr:DUF6273 domain-containing protein [Synergistaceae bacterium]